LPVFAGGPSCSTIIFAALKRRFLYLDTSFSNQSIIVAPAFAVRQVAIPFMNLLFGTEK
jgi:hypothetical protein